MQRIAEQSATVRNLFIVAILLMITAGMRVAEPILVPFILAVFIAIICMPSLLWLQRKCVPKVLSVIIIITGVLLVILVMTILVGQSINKFTQSLPGYEVSLMKKTALFELWVEKTGIEIPDQFFREYVNAGTAMKFIARLLARLGKVLTNIFLILLIITFILLEAKSFPVKMRTASKNPDEFSSNFNKFTENINRYMLIKTLSNLLTGVAITILLAIIGVNFPVLWGLLAFMFCYIPTIGAIIAVIPVALLALIQLGTIPALFTLLGYLVINIITGSFIEPRYMGRGLGLSTLVVILSLIFWGWVLGPVGMLLSAPLTMTIKIALESSEDTRGISVLLGSEEPAEDNSKM